MFLRKARGVRSGVVAKDANAIIFSYDDILCFSAVSWGSRCKLQSCDCFASWHEFRSADGKIIVTMILRTEGVVLNFSDDGVRSCAATVFWTWYNDTFRPPSRFNKRPMNTRLQFVTQSRKRNGSSAYGRWRRHTLTAKRYCNGCVNRRWRYPLRTLKKK